MLVNTKKTNLKVCLVQICSSNILEDNVKKLKELENISENFDLIVLPEMVNIFEKNKEKMIKQIKSMDEDLFIKKCILIAKKKNAWILIGSTAVKEKNKLFNRSILLNNLGEVVIYYDKINLFKAKLREYFINENNIFEKGSIGKIKDTPWGKVALCICYDLRFPNLFRSYAQKGARIIFVPSAFTVTTGKDHWEPLLKARAIENGVWIIAPAQVGKHKDGRETYGHSLIINPWGNKIVDLGGKFPKTKTVSINLNEIEKVREKVCSFNVDEPFSIIKN